MQNYVSNIHVSASAAVTQCLARIAFLLQQGPTGEARELQDRASRPTNLAETTVSRGAIPTETKLPESNESETASPRKPS